MITGTTDYLRTAESVVLDYILDNCCEEIPPFYPPEFQAVADAFLFDQFAMTQADINLDNVKIVYMFLVEVISL